MSKRQAVSVVDRIKTPSVIMCVAKKFSGKSHLVKWIMCDFIRAGRFDYGLIVSPTAMNGQWDILGEEFQHSTFDDKIITSMINKQKAFKAAGQEVNAFILLDDCVGTVNFNNKIFQFLVTAGRQINITVVLIVQKFTDAVTPLVRQNSDYILMLRQPDMNVIKQLHIEYGANYGSRSEWEALFKTHVQNFTALFYDNMSQSNDRTALYALIKAPAEYQAVRLEWGEGDDGEE